MRSGDVSYLAPVALRTSSSVTPYASSVRMSFFDSRSTWKTQTALRRERSAAEG
jgi:hypothetical protein